MNEDENVEAGKKFIQKKGYSMPISSRAGEIPSDYFKKGETVRAVVKKVELRGSGIHKNHLFSQHINLTSFMP